MFWQKIGNSVSDRLFRDSVRDSVIAENQCLYVCVHQYVYLSCSCMCIYLRVYDVCMHVCMYMYVSQ